MTKTRLMSCLAAAAVFAGCSHAPPPAPAKAPVAEACANGPDWTCQGSGACSLPELKGMICAVGSAQGITLVSLGRETASTDARRAMAAFVKSEVAGFTRVVQESAMKTGVGEDSIQKVQSAAQNMVNETLHGVSVPRMHFNDQQKTHYALAALDAQKFVEALKGLKQAGALSEEVKKEIDARADNVMAEWNKERAR